MTRSVGCRWLRRAILGALLFVACGSESRRGGAEPAERTLEPGDHAFELTHDGRARRYQVHVPNGAEGRRPVLLALHGGGGSGAQFKADNGLDPVAEREGFLAVYPDGTGPLRGRLLTWNAGTHCCGWAREHDVDDVGFLAAVIDDLAERTGIDRGRVYATGHSNGAIMAYRLAVERADLVAAIVPVAGAMAVAEFRPSRPVAVLHIHSVDDPRALYEGGLGPPFPGTDNRVDHAPVVTGLAAWAERNGCGATLAEVAVVEGDPRNPGQTLTRLAHPGCDPGGAVEHVRLTGSGHGWPGAPMSAPMRRLSGSPTTLIDASAEAWSFASRFAR